MLVDLFDIYLYDILDILVQIHLVYNNHMVIGASGHASISTYNIPISFMMTNKSRYVWGKIFDGGNKNLAIKLQKNKKIVNVINK